MQVAALNILPRHSFTILFLWTYTRTYTKKKLNRIIVFLFDHDIAFQNLYHNTLDPTNKGSIVWRIQHHNETHHTTIPFSIPNTRQSAKPPLICGQIKSLCHCIFQDPFQSSFYN